MTTAKTCVWFWLAVGHLVLCVYFLILASPYFAIASAASALACIALEYALDNRRERS